MKRLKNTLFRLYVLMNRTAIKNTVLTVINLLPLFGVLFFGWEAFAILLLYFFEGAIAIIFGFVRILRNDPDMPVDPDDGDPRGETLAKGCLFVMFLWIYFSFQAILLGYIVMAAGHEQDWHTIINIYGFVVFFIFIGYQIVYQFHYSRRIAKKKINRHMGYLYLKNMVIFLLVYFTKSFTIALICLILFKTILDVLPVVRRRIYPDAPSTPI